VTIITTMFSSSRHSRIDLRASSSLRRNSISITLRLFSQSLASQNRNIPMRQKPRRKNKPWLGYVPSRLKYLRTSPQIKRGEEGGGFRIRISGRGGFFWLPLSSRSANFSSRNLGGRGPWLAGRRDDLHEADGGFWQGAGCLGTRGRGKFSSLEILATASCESAA
jgi:hypothetical protein